MEIYVAQLNGMFLGKEIVVLKKYKYAKEERTKRIVLRDVTRIQFGVYGLGTEGEDVALDIYAKVGSREYYEWTQLALDDKVEIIMEEDNK